METKKKRKPILVQTEGRSEFGQNIQESTEETSLISPAPTDSTATKLEKSFLEDVIKPTIKMAGKASLYSAGALTFTGLVATAVTYGIGALTTAATAMTSVATTVTATLGISSAGGLLASLGTLSAGAVASGGLIAAAALVVAAVTFIAYGAYKFYKHCRTSEKEKDIELSDTTASPSPTKPSYGTPFQRISEELRQASAASADRRGVLVSP